MNETIYLPPRHSSGGCIHILEGRGRLQSVRLGDYLAMGYSPPQYPRCTLNSKFVSGSHGEFRRSGGQFTYRDTGSRNGTWLGSRFLTPMQDTPLQEGDILRIGDMSQPEDERNVLILFTGEDTPGPWVTFTPPVDTASFVAGRQAVSRGDLRLSGPAVSRSQCIIRRTAMGWTAENLASVNPTLLNGRLLERPTFLYPQDVLRMGDTWVVYDGVSFYVLSPAAEEEEDSDGTAALDGRGRSPGSMSSQETLFLGDDEEEEEYIRRQPPRRPQPKTPQQPRGIQQVQRRQPQKDRDRRLDIHIKRRTARQRMTSVDLLRDIDLSVHPGELVLILGGSGAGKTTFLNAVMGYEKADGQILFAGKDVYRNYEQMKYEIGYVPQQDLLRMGDSVLQTLRNAAQMKLPTDTPAQTREQKVQETLSAFGLEREMNSRVSKLSGGQRKRLSIAVEFIGQPSLFFLDEPDSGLDGVMARGLMENLRYIADTRKIVLVITHGPDRAQDLFDKVLVLAKSEKDNCGRMAFYGDVPAAKKFFQTESLEQIVRRVNRRDEGGDGRADYYIGAFEKLQKGVR